MRKPQKKLDIKELSLFAFKKRKHAYHKLKVETEQENNYW